MAGVQQQSPAISSIPLDVHYEVAGAVEYRVFSRGTRASSAAMRFFGSGGLAFEEQAQVRSGSAGVGA